MIFVTGRFGQRERQFSLSAKGSQQIRGNPAVILVADQDHLDNRLPDLLPLRSWRRPGSRLDISPKSGPGNTINCGCLSRVRGASDSVIASPTVCHPNVVVRALHSSGRRRAANAGVLGEMARHESLFSTSPRRAALEPAIADLARHDLRELRRDLRTTDPSRRGVGEAVDLLEDSPTLRLEKLDHARDDQQAPVVTVPTTRRFAAWSRRYLMVVAGADALLGGIAAAIPASISNTLSGHNAVPLICLVGLIVWPVAIALCRGYRRNRIGIGFDEPGAVIRAGMLVVVAVALPAGLMAVPTGALDPTGPLTFTLYALLKLVATGIPFAVLLSLLVRFVARRGLHFLQSRGRSLRHVVVVGSFGAAQQLSECIQREPDTGMKVIGLCLPSTELPRPVVAGIPVLGSLGQVPEVVRAMGCDAVAVTSDDATRYNYLRELAWSLEGAGVELLVDPGLVEVAGPRMHIRPLMGFPLLHVEEPHFTGWRWVVKRVNDLLLTSLGLLIISPLMLGIAAVIKLQDGGPVIFRQARIGRDGKPFTMLKFRSMIVDAEDRKLELMARNEGKGGLFKLSRDPRVTPFGQFLRDFSLDELPQLFNVLAGSMSLVGPRPHLASELARMPNEASRRSLVTPGLTGLWQVSGRSDLEGDEAIRLDLRYVENWSFTLDLLILWRTISAVLARRGAH
jgi:exopolysaccharide biosynthesis polyprenyl glycosylphosphotransferase